MSNIKNTLIENEYLNQVNLDLEEENRQLKEQLTYFKARNFSLVKHCQKLASRNQKLECEIADLRFTHKYLTSEEAGKKFAEELLGGI